MDVRFDCGQESQELASPMLNPDMALDFPRTLQVRWFGYNRHNRPFLQQDSGHTGITDSDLCACPGGNLSQPGQPFWGTIGEDMLSSDYVDSTPAAYEILTL
jgi:hypothetical protein